MTESRTIRTKSRNNTSFANAQNPPEKFVKHELLGEWFTRFSSVLPTSQVVYCAGKPIERVVYRCYEITMEKLCQWEENLLCFRDQVAYSHQNHEMTQQTNHSDWKNENTDSPPSAKSAEQSDENILRYERFKKVKEKPIGERQSIFINIKQFKEERTCTTRI